MAIERTQPMLVQTAEQFGGENEPRRAKATPRQPGGGAMMFAIALGAFWIGVIGAFLVGYFGLDGIGKLTLQELAGSAAFVFIPPALFIATAWAFSKGLQMSATADALIDATDRLFTADETASRTAARLGRAVRRELDALNAGLDGAFQRLRALESVLENQIAALDEAGARADVRGEAVTARLTAERERIENVANSLGDVAARASEVVAGRAAQLKATIETAESTLKTAGISLESQAADFRNAANAAAEAPHTAAIELDKQAKRIESVSDAALARAEFVLGRHERHRTAMTDLLGRMKEDSTGFEASLAAQRAAMDNAIDSLKAEAQRFEALTTGTEHNLENIMANAGARAAQIAASFSREADKLRDVSETANNTLARLVDGLRDAGAHAQTLIGEAAGEAKVNAKSLVGDAMAECDRLLRAAGELAEQAALVRKQLGAASEEVEGHILTLPNIAQQEAQRVREMVRGETEEILDLSARTLSTIHSRSVSRPAPRPMVSEAPPPEERESEGLRGLARRLTQRQTPPAAPKPKKPLPSGEAGRWEMSTLLAAVDNDKKQGGLKPSSAAALGALEAALADMAVDLDGIAGDHPPSEEDWRKYMAGDRAVFARRLATTIDDQTVDRITALYRDDQRFHDQADAYMTDFESLLSRAKEGDGGGLLASSILSADTGKIYLAMAYALGRLN
jgi:hypothetical protein